MSRVTNTASNECQELAIGFSKGNFRMAGNIAPTLTISFDNFGDLWCHITQRANLAVKILPVFRMICFLFVHCRAAVH